MSESFGRNSGVSEAKIKEIEAATGLTFPASYRDFLLKTDGVFFEAQDLKILSLKESVQYYEGICSFGIIQTWGLFPILDNNDSNPWCLCCKAPLIGYIVQVFHDDAAQVKFRSIESFFKKIQHAESDDVMLLDDLEGDFRSSERTSHDIEVAEELVMNLGVYKGLDRGDACRFAMWLFGNEHVDRIAVFLEDEDAFVARDARERLEVMQSPKSQEAMRIAKKKLIDFINRSLFLLKEAGIQAIHEGNSILCVNPGNIRLDMNTFYAKRKIPNAEEQFIERVRSFISDARH